MDKPVFLYVEDDAMSRSVLEMFMKRGLGHEEFYVFEDSRDILSRMMTLPHKPSVIFLDIHMEPHDGFTVLKMLREQEAYHNTQVVALTASVMNEEIDMLREAGFDGVIGKPID